MIDPDRWLRLLFELHARHTEDDTDLTRAERRAVLDFTAAVHRFENPTGELSN